MKRDFSIYVKGVKVSNKKLVKLKLIFYKPGYARVKKDLGIQASSNNWDEENKLFKRKSSEASKYNALLEAEISKYQDVADRWEKEGKNWSPKELSHYFEFVKEHTTPEVKIRSVEDLLEERRVYFENKKRVVNGTVVSSKNNAKNYLILKNSLRQFTRKVYRKDFAVFYFKDINEKFLQDFAFYIKTTSIGNKGGLPQKLGLLRAICRYAKKSNVFEFKETTFECVADDMQKKSKGPKTISWSNIIKIENLDRSKFKVQENLHIDLFLFSCYVGGMSNIDVCNLTYSMIKGDKIIYERQKTSKEAKPMIPEKAKALMKKYIEKSFEDYVFPVFLARHVTEQQRLDRFEYICTRVNKTLNKVRKKIRCREDITWYTARGTYISALLDAGENIGAVSEQAGNTSHIISKHYYKNTQEARTLHRMNKVFNAEVI